MILVFQKELITTLLFFFAIYEKKVQQLIIMTRFGREEKRKKIKIIETKMIYPCVCV